MVALLILRGKRIDATLAVLAALDFLRETFRNARRQDMVLLSGLDVRPGTQYEYMRRTEPQREEHGAAMSRIREAAHDLRRAQASAASLWGKEAKAPLKGVFNAVGGYEKTVAIFWPMAVEAAMFMDTHEPTETYSRSAALQSLTSSVFGAENDVIGAPFEAALGIAEQWYEAKKAWMGSRLAGRAQALYQRLRGRAVDLPDVRR